MYIKTLKIKKKVWLSAGIEPPTISTDQLVTARLTNSATEVIIIFNRPTKFLNFSIGDDCYIVSIGKIINYQ